ncbi:MULTISPECIES: hypothetical protein [Parachlamydia]|uniref:hypothetical protein n=1 Tax=Parachlamydia TaxID=83551 RepID=UPI0001C17B37|nr:hypothetical protein [Parachlamydia acanthamoebae]EFB42753.1 hypothetical protein pah_c003o035 [Parachlamydia acanthamoebae str. Hall's coccus]
MTSSSSNVHFSAATTSVPLTEKGKKPRSKFFTVCITILKSPFTFFHAACFWKKRSVKLSPTQKTTIQEIHKDPAYLQTKQIRPTFATPKEDTAAASEKNVAAKPKEDIALEKLRQFTQDFCVHFADSLFDEKLKSPLKSMNPTPEMIDRVNGGIKFFLGHIIDATTKALDTVVQSDIGKNFKEIAENNKRADELATKLFAWLFKDQEGRNLREEIEEKLNDKTIELAKLKGIDIPENVSFLEDGYADKILKWVFESDHRDYSQVFLGSDPLKNELQGLVVNAVIQLLIENKISYFQDKIQYTLQDKLVDVVRELFTNSASKIGATVADRLAFQIKAADYTGTFDSILNIITKHTEAYIIADKKAEKYLKKARKAKSLRAHTPEEELSKQEFLNVATAIKEQGKDAVKKQHMALFFANEHACHPTITKMLIVPDETLRENTAKSAENNLYTHISAELFKVLLPSSNFEGDQEKTGLEQIWDMLIDKTNLPDELESLVTEFKETFVNFMHQDQLGDLAGIQDAFFSFTKTLALSTAEEIIKQQISNGARKMVEMLSNQNSLEELLAMQILPTLSDQFLAANVRQTIFNSKNIKKMAPLFLRASQSGSETDAVKQDIQNTIFEISKKSFNSFDMQKMDQAEFTKIITPVIEEIETLLQVTLQPTDSVKEVITIMQEYNKGIKADRNSTYGKLLMHAGFGLSSLKIFGGKKLSKMLLSMFKGQVSQQISNAAYTGSHSYVKPLYNALSSAQESFGSKDQVQKLFFGETAHLSEKKRKQRLQKEIDKTSRLAHDLLRQGVKTNIGSAALLFVPSCDSINHVVTDFVQKLLLTDPAINKSLIFRIQKRVLDALKAENSPEMADDSHPT